MRTAIEAAKCEHDFEYLYETTRGGQTARCRLCRCRFTAWPGTVHYGEIVAARDAQKVEGRP